MSINPELPSETMAHACVRKRTSMRKHGLHGQRRFLSDFGDMPHTRIKQLSGTRIDLFHLILSVEICVISVLSFVSSEGVPTLSGQEF